jgi:hypothetical protein
MITGLMKVPLMDASRWPFEAFEYADFLHQLEMRLLATTEHREQ